jgi:GNAT superfamily N-acetyltransferase
LRSSPTSATAALRDDRAEVHIAVQGRRYAGFCAYGVNGPHETGSLSTTPDLRWLGIGGPLLRRCLADQRDRGLRASDVAV